jgi:hypothetical protein
MNATNSSTLGPVALSSVKEDGSIVGMIINILVGPLVGAVQGGQAHPDLSARDVFCVW